MADEKTEQKYKEKAQDQPESTRSRNDPNKTAYYSCMVC